jgi:hypothetical protein
METQYWGNANSSKKLTTQSGSCLAGFIQSPEYRNLSKIPKQDLISSSGQVVGTIEQGNVSSHGPLIPGKHVRCSSAGIGALKL